MKRTKVRCTNVDPLPGSDGVTPIYPFGLEVGKEYPLCTRFEEDEDLELLGQYHYLDIGVLIEKDKKPLFTHSLETGAEIPDADLVKWFSWKWFDKQEVKNAG